MRKPFLVLLLCLSVFALSAFAEEWNKTYQVGDKPSLRVETNDASVEVTRGTSRTISARVITDGYSATKSLAAISSSQLPRRVLVGHQPGMG